MKETGIRKQRLTAPVIPVILCGGSGTRLWPLSCEDRPKQFLSLSGGRSLLQNTALRAMRCAGVPPSGVVTVTLGSAARETRRQLRALDPALDRHVLIEPEARNTAAAIALAAHYVRPVFGEDALLWVLPSDHHIADEGALGAALQKGIRAAGEGYLVLFGIPPSRPETGYGYIMPAEGGEKDGYAPVAAFAEKPDAETAQGYIEAGRLWSSGLHLFRADAALESFTLHDPDTLRLVASAAPAGKMQAPAAFFYGMIKSQPFEKSILEKARRKAVVPCDPGWSDIGTWQSLWETGDKDTSGNVKQGRVLCRDMKDSIIHAGDRLVACAGLDNVVVAVTADAVLVADKNDAGALKALVRKLQEDGAPEARVPETGEQGRGARIVLSDTPESVISEIVVSGGGEWSFTGAAAGTQLTALSGTVNIHVDGRLQQLGRRQAVFVPAGAACTVSNPAADGRRFLAVEYRPADGRKGHETQSEAKFLRYAAA